MAKLDWVTPYVPPPPPPPPAPPPGPVFGCPVCGCLKLVSYQGRRKGRAMIRIRKCSACGKRVRSIERLTG